LQQGKSLQALSQPVPQQQVSHTGQHAMATAPKDRLSESAQVNSFNMTVLLLKF
jgi:hypothetical protein